jgi:hypothetical protein
MTKGVFRMMLIKSAYSKEEFERMLEQTNFSREEIIEEGIGFEIWMTK